MVGRGGRAAVGSGRWDGRSQKCQTRLTCFRRLKFFRFTRMEALQNIFPTINAEVSSERVLRASTGKSRSQHGLNMPEIRAILQAFNRVPNRAMRADLDTALQLLLQDLHILPGRGTGRQPLIADERADQVQPAPAVALPLAMPRAEPHAMLQAQGPPRTPPRSFIISSTDCRVCLNSCDQGCNETVVHCRNGHPIHRQCLDRMIIDSCNAVLIDLSKPSAIRCCFHGCFERPPCEQNPRPQAAAFTEQQLSEGASEDALGLLRRVADAERELATLVEEEQIRQSNKSTYMCPKCSFGPVAHAYCRHLDTHHKDPRGISNACPKCGFFAANIDQWRPWDGNLAAGAVGGCSMDASQARGQVFDGC